MTKKPGQPGFFMRGDFFCASKPQGAVPNATADESDPLPPSAGSCGPNAEGARRRRSAEGRNFRRNFRRVSP